MFINIHSLAAGWNRDRVMKQISELGVPCLQGTCSEVYLEKAFDGTSFRPSERLPSAKELGETSLMFQVHPNLSESEMRSIGELAKSIFRQAQR